MDPLVGGGWIGKGGERSGLQIHRGVNPPQAANLPKYLVVVVLLCCYVVGCIYIPDLPTYLVFYLETTRGSSIDTPTMTTTPTHFKSWEVYPITVIFQK